MATMINPITSNAGSNSGSNSSTSSTSSGSQPNEQMFLQLLVSQLQNQDPLNPTDGTQFVSELAQFSELEQVMAIRGDIEQYHTQATAAAGSTPSSGAAGTGSTDANGRTPTTQN